MTKSELAETKALAEKNEEINEDDQVLYGLYLHTFKPVTTTIRVVAKFMRYHCMQLNGEWDTSELHKFCEFARRRITVI
jgi:hypothetical protein